MTINRPTYIFATNNAHKLTEARQILGEFADILSLDEIGCHDDIPENAPDLQGNALAKARWIHEKYGRNCFADDTGLEVDALNGEPGVHTARYAGPNHDSTANMALLLKNLSDKKDRAARFRTVVALIDDDGEHLFDGKVEGSIAREPSGTAGFGYDPVFVPEGDTRCFAEYSADEKNAVSHRGRALRKMVEYISQKTI